MEKIRISLAQMNPTVGDLAGNTEKIKSYIETAREAGADIVAFPEMAVTGYPPEDLLLKPGFVRESMEALRSIEKSTGGITAVVGCIIEEKGLYNAAAVFHDGRLAGCYRKMRLPNYSVFDEERYFRKGDSPMIFTLNGVRIGVTICEDIWYEDGPVSAEAHGGAGIIININASPFYFGKWKVREDLVSSQARKNGVSIAYVNTVGGQDELVFDGHSMVFDNKGRLLARGYSFEEELITVDVEGESRAKDGPSIDIIDLGASAASRRDALPHKDIPAPPDRIDEVYRALVFGTRDYVRKNRFGKVVIALSGGVDSVLVASIAAEAVGPENVVTIFMPSFYSSRDSREDAEAVAKNLSVRLLTIPIQETFESYKKDLAEIFKGMEPDVAEENLQARTRGNIIMALSNKFGWLVLTTGNKSEMSVGYATLYGDMAGGFAVIKDVPKTLVYEVCRHINRIKGKEIIPERVFTKPPTAELKPDQTDQDTLPPYDVLDEILKAYIEENKGREEIVSLGFEEAVVRKVIRMVDLSEYKRRQAPPGIKITTRALGKDWRMPVTNGYRNY